jgi:hypothetical protein
MAAPATQASECSMAGEMPDQPLDHTKMACCTSDCTMAGIAGLVQGDSGGLPSSEPIKAPLFLASVKELDSLDWATVDPPPRPFFS